ncbi:MAG: YbaB/EbfC family nucleoid-associated protein [Oscillospiraceae bacterium]|nr:YbaB/EbfC family nucleoid-associated protein [Oscillospiraceae bacterium]
MKARVPKQFQGGGQNMDSMIHQAKKMQDQITALQEDIEQRTFEAAAGGGAVKVVLTGKKTIEAITLDPEMVKEGDVEMMQDLIISAVNEAINTVEETTEKEMSKITGGVALPGLF